MRIFVSAEIIKEQKSPARIAESRRPSTSIKSGYDNAGRVFEAGEWRAPGYLSE